MSKQHTVSILVLDQPGVLQRVCGLFSRRGFNIDSITVGSCEEAGLSRMIIVSTGDDRAIEQLQKQLNKLIDIVRVEYLSSSPMVARELALIKVRAEPVRRPELLGVVETYRASVVDFGADSMIIQAVGDSSKVESMLELLQPYGVLELSRTGITAIRRGGPI
ncbi:acetolactate synthase small subunit [Paenibacillus piri]|uniref:Acetolactate synthase small subunit n=1 Tax=Paenibacillus piri TaxID=2547395 RepID=A0A4R5KYS3_9BACL|nr:acetolactate synthase small subunit [Paenibacillus piri]TDG00753.1 acetolactate synthase small subunit [Paenibacillus piri]